MARIIRASFLLLTTIGVAALLSATAAAANGGATPIGSISSSSGGGASPDAVPSQRQPSGAPVREERVGGANANSRPKLPRRQARAAPRPKAKAKAKPKPKRRPAAQPAPAPAPVEPVEPAVPTVSGVFPVQGTYAFGSDDARFGAGRTGHLHQGQDVLAASGTPLVAPVGGTITWKRNQESGAGIYLVLRGGDGRDYVFMHLKRGSVLVEPGENVAQGQQIAQVGATGRADGPHLHFEIWVGGWYERGGAPIDPLPQLQRWAGIA